MSAWTDHVKKVSKEKGISYKEAMKVAGETYKKPEKKAVSKPKEGDKPEKRKKCPRGERLIDGVCKKTKIKLIKRTAVPFEEKKKAKPKKKPTPKKKAEPKEEEDDDEPKPDISQENWFRINPFNTFANPGVGVPSADSEDRKKGFVRNLWFIRSRKKDEYQSYEGWWKTKPTKTGVTFVLTNNRSGASGNIPQKKRYSLSYKKLKTMLRKIDPDSDRLKYETDILRRYEFIGQDSGGELKDTFT